MKTVKKTQEESEQATRWAEQAGIMEVEDPQTTVTCGELAGILYRTLEYFFDRLIAAVETAERKQPAGRTENSDRKPPLG